MDMILDHIEVLAPDVQTFWLKPEHRFRYTAGEFVEVHLPHDHPDNRGDTRWFSLSSSPTENLVAITSKFAQERSSSFKQALRALRPGDHLRLSQPMGDFILPKSTEAPIVFVTRGIGVTPIRSITKWLADSGQQRRIKLIYAAGADSTQLYANLLHATYGANFYKPTTRITAATILEQGDNNPATLYYLSGPEVMIKALADGLRLAGVPNEQIVTDYFPGYPA